MLPSIKNSDGTKTKVLSKREEKKRINIRWNSWLYFQIGLVVSLLLSFAAMEMTWDAKPVAVFDPGPDYILENHTWENYVLEQPKIPIKEEVIVKKRPEVPNVTIASRFTQVDNQTQVTETETGNSELTDAPMIPDPPKQPVDTKPERTRNVNEVSSVPTFPGCEGLMGNQAKLECLSSKIRSFVGRKFDTDKYSEKYAGQTLKINVQFTIDAQGKVTDVLARSAGKDLEGEAIQVMSKLPEMEPAEDGNRNVPVIYRMPIVFRAQY